MLAIPKSAARGILRPVGRRTSDGNPGTFPHLDPRYGETSFRKRGASGSSVLLGRVSLGGEITLTVSWTGYTPMGLLRLGFRRTPGSREDGFHPANEATPPEFLDPGVAPGGNGGGFEDIPPTLTFMRGSIPACTALTVAYGWSYILRQQPVRIATTAMGDLSAS